MARSRKKDYECTSHTTVRSGREYGGSLNMALMLFTPLILVLITVNVTIS